jgi:hypothetical protein
MRIVTAAGPSTGWLARTVAGPAELGRVRTQAAPAPPAAAKAERIVADQQGGAVHPELDPRSGVGTGCPVGVYRAEHDPGLVGAVTDQLGIVGSDQQPVGGRVRRTGGWPP